MKGHGRLVKLSMGTLAAIFLLAAPAAMAKAESSISLICGKAYWASYSDYLARKLTVPYSISNNGDATAYNVTFQSATATDPVTKWSDLPIWMGDMEPGASNVIPFVWNVPAGVSRFVSKVSICSDCDPPICVGEENADDYGEPDLDANGGINIKPGSCPNSINMGGGGNITVAVYSYGDFDAQSLDESTVIFAGASPTKSSTEDVDGDGRLDVVFHFNKADVDLEPGDTRACLSAQITGGGSYRSCDMVRVL